MLRFVFQAHLRLALDAALLFAVGLFASYPVVRYRWRGAAALPLALFRIVLWLMGPSPTIARMAGVIWAFNSLVMFIDMASGFHPLLPKVLCIWTGLNVGIVMGMAPREPGLPVAWRLRPGQWAPPEDLGRACGLLVLLLELPCLFYAVAMGINMGLLVQQGVLHYLPALAVRARAYASVLVPVLLVSAVAEAIAMRAASAPDSGPH